jgi:aminoglycoside 3-N-acetyltransferase
MILLVHASLSALGWVCGGPVTVVQSLMHAVSERGTVVMPTHSREYSNPEKWKNPPVPHTWVLPIKETMPAFHPAYTPSSLGKIVECFRHFPGVMRSDHPSLSFAAWGASKEKIIQNHSLDFGLGDQSPLARIYELGGYVLLLGVPYAHNTSFHLAEYRSRLRPQIYEEAPIGEGGRRVWRSYRDIEYSNSDFEIIGAVLEKTGQVTTGFVGLAESRLFSQPQAVDFALKWYIETGS